MTPRAAMILCAGLGTRLRPLTEWLAKPMVPVGDAPALSPIVAALRSYAPIERIVVNVHHRPDDLRSWAEANAIKVSEEREDLLGTAGGVEHAKDLLGEGDVLIWNGDISCAFDITALLDQHTADATLVVVERANAKPGEGNVGLSADGRVVRLRKESFGGEETRGADFTGIHILGARLRSKLPRKGCLVGDVYIPALRDGAQLGSFVVPSFVDVGSIAEYVAANRAWLGKRSSFTASSATIAENVSVEGSIIGGRARVEADAVRCIVWPGTHVRERVADAIVTPHGNVDVSAILST